jgi:hypothetical protein
MDTVRLRHGTWTDYVTMPDRLEPFYDGRAVAHNGIVELPVGQPTWIRAAFLRGYNLTPDGRRMFTFLDLDNEVARQTAEQPEEAKKPTRKETHEGSHTRRQSPS